jgi:hypothetical protein
VSLVALGGLFLVSDPSQLVLDFTFQKRLSIIAYKIGMWRKVGVFAAMSGQDPDGGDNEAKSSAVRVCGLIPVGVFRRHAALG